MAIHADVIGEPTGQLGRVNDRVVKFTCHRQLPASFIHVQLAGAVAVLAADRELSKRRVLVSARAIWNGLHSAAVTGETPCLYGAAKPGVFHFITGRKAPTSNPRVVAEGRLEQRVATLHQIGRAIGSAANHKLESVRHAKHFAAR